MIDKSTWDFVLDRSYRMAAPGEVEVFRLTPEVGKCYKHAEYTRRTGRWPNERYFFTGEPRYVGRFIETIHQGHGEGGYAWSIFDDDGVKNRVDYSYEARTSFVEVPCQGRPAEMGKSSRRSRKNRRRNRRSRRHRR